MESTAARSVVKPRQVVMRSLVDSLNFLPTSKPKSDPTTIVDTFKSVPRPTKPLKLLALDIDAEYQQLPVDRVSPYGS